MAVDAEVILKDLESEKFAPVYFLHGTEPYYIDQISNFIEKNALQEHEKSFNQTVVYGKEVNFVRVLESAKKFPMMAERQVVIVKEAQDMSEFSKEKNEIFEKQFLGYLQNPMPSTILVFCYKKKLDGKKTITKNIDKFAVLVESDPIKDYEMNKWADKYFAQHKLKITPRAMHLLVESIGTNLSAFHNEVEKLKINLKDKAEIDEALVHKYVGISKDYNVFELQNALAQKNALKVHQIIQYFDSNPKDNNHIIPVLASLFGYFNKILLVHSAEDKSQYALGSLLKLPPKIAEDYAKAAKNFPLNKTISIIHEIHVSDLKSKGVGTGSAKNKDILTDLVNFILS